MFIESGRSFFNTGQASSDSKETEEIRYRIIPSKFFEPFETCLPEPEKVPSTTETRSEYRWGTIFKHNAILVCRSVKYQRAFDNGEDFIGKIIIPQMGKGPRVVFCRCKRIR